jgi:hypothetical protein
MKNNDCLLQQSFLHSLQKSQKIIYELAET